MSLNVTPASPEMVAAYEGGERTRSIAERYGLGQSTVQQKLRAAGVKMRRAGTVRITALDDLRERITEAYREGKSARQIAIDLGFSPQSVMNRLVEWEVPRRPARHQPRAFDRELATHLNLEGFTDGEIAERLSCARDTIKAWRIRADIPPRARCAACSRVFENTSGRGAHCGECGYRKCSRCEEVKPLDEYYSRSRAVDNAQPVCKPCQRWRYIKDTYGLSREEVEALLASQDGRCPMCGVGVDERGHIDHDHTCCPGDKSCGSCVRGILDAGCNQMIGLARDLPETLRRAAEYLENSA